MDGSFEGGKIECTSFARRIPNERRSITRQPAMASFPDTSTFSSSPLPHSLPKRRLLRLAPRTLLHKQPVSAASFHIKALSSSSPPPEEQRPLWLPGLDPPSHLDGSLPGDFGFDPLELGKDSEALNWYVQAELIHARFAMAGVAGILFTDILRTTGLKDLPVWYEAGATKFDFADTQSLFFVQLILMGFVETKRYMDIKEPHSQGTEDSFFGLETALQGLEPGYPGGPLFNPFGLGIGAGNLKLLKVKEIKNGRLAMVAMLGFIVQASFTKAGPIDNLLAHLSDPWHNTIIKTLTSQ